MSRMLGRHLTFAGLISALTLLAVLALVGSASAATRTVGFDDVMPDTRVSTEYETSHGVTFPDDPGARPMVKTSPARRTRATAWVSAPARGYPGAARPFRRGCVACSRTPPAP